MRGYGEKQKKDQNQQLGKNSIPVGYETIMEMYPLDFEEFLWANGISEKIIDVLHDCFLKEEPVPAGIHYSMTQLLYRYIVVGGLPAVVNKFLETKHIGQVAALAKSVISEYEDDMVK